MASLNSVELIGNIVANPEIRAFSNGNEVANIRVATSERWKDKETGDMKEATQFHNVAIFNKSLVKICKDYLTKGSQIYVQGKLQTRNYEKDGSKVYVTEIVLQGFDGKIIMLGGKRRGDSQHNSQTQSFVDSQGDLDDEILF